ncbi:DUF2291 family protein [Halomonas sp. AOP5-B2-8]
MSLSKVFFVSGLAIAMLSTLSGFKLVSKDELATILNDGSAVSINAEELMHDDIIPWVNSNSEPLNLVLSAIASEGFQAACEQYGVQQSQAFPCTFWVSVSETVESVDTSSRVGKINLGSVQQKEVSLLIGPVIPGSAVRDGYPELGYADFANQDQFATFGDELNVQVISILESFGNVNNGDVVETYGAFSTWDGLGDTVEIVPVALNRVNAE